MSEVIFIRHAETDMAGTFCGHSDPQLNARGQAQLAELIQTLQIEDIGEVHSSDLLRAQATGREIAKAFAVKCHLRPALREINFGQWEGLTWERVERRDSVYAQCWVKEYPNMPAPGGEHFDVFEKRVLDEVQLLVQEAAGRDIAVVTHAGVLRTVLCRLHGCSEGEALRLTKSYCSIIRHKILTPTSMRFAAVRS